MSEKIGGLTVELSGEAKGLIAAVNQSTSALGKMIPSIRSMAGAVALGNAAWAAASQAMGMAKAATFDLVAASMDFIDANNDISAKTGISTASLGMLEYAAKMNGTEFETLTKSVGKMLKVQGEVQAGNDGAGKSFEALGISLEQVKSLSTEDLLGTVADQIRALPTTAMQAAAAMSIFGKSGADLLPLLQGGSAGIAEMTQEAGDLGLMIGSIDSAKVGQANDAIDKMKFLFKGVGNVLAVEIAPFIEAVVTDTIEWADAGKGLRSNVLSAIEDTGKAVATAIDYSKDLVRIWYDAQAAVLLMGSAAAVASGQFGFAKDLFAAHKDALQLEEDMKASSSWGDKFSKAMKQIRDDADAAANAAGGLPGATGQQGGEYQKGSALDDMEKSAARIVESTRLPIEKYNETIKELNDLASAGMIDAETHARATAKAVEDLGTATGEYADIQAKQQKADAMYSSTRTPLEQYAAKLKEVNDLLSGGYIDAETATRSTKSAWDDLAKSSENYGDSIADATGNIDDMARSLGNLGSASEVDLGALTGGARLLGGGGGMDTFGGFADTGAAFGGSTPGAESYGGHGTQQLDRIAMFLEMLVALGKQPSTVEFSGGLTSEYSA